MCFHLWKKDRSRNDLYPIYVKHFKKLNLSLIFVLPFRMHLMNTYIVSYDITDKLIDCLSLQSIVVLMQLNSEIAALINATPLGKQLHILQNVRRGKNIFCHQLAYVQMLEKVPQFLYCESFLETIAMSQHLSVLNLYARLGNRFQNYQSVIVSCFRYGKNSSLEWFRTNGYPIQFNMFDVDELIKTGSIQTLEWGWLHGYNMQCSENGVCYMVYHNHLNILIWFKKVNLNLSVCEHAINLAIFHNRLDFLEWFKNNGYPLSCSLNIFDRAIKKNNLALIIWAINNQLPVTYSEQATNKALVYRHFPTLNYLIVHGFVISCSEQTVDLIIEKTRDITLLDWLIKNHFVLTCEKGFEWALKYQLTDVLDYLIANDVRCNYTSQTLTNIARHVTVEMLDWLQANFGIIKYTSETIDLFVRYQSLNLLEWLVFHSYVIKYNDAIHIAARYGYVQILEWFRTNHIPLEYDSSAISIAAQNNHVNVLDWFFDHHLFIPGGKNLLNCAAYNDCLDVLEWCKTHHLMWSYDPHTILKQGKLAIDWLTQNGFNTDHLRS